MKLPKALNEATAGAALKYHIKRALERSHSISDFSKQLELSAKNSQFTNNTLKIIEELNNGVKQASEEIKEKACDFSNEKLTNEQIKELLNNAEIPTSGRDAIIFGTNNLNPEIVEFLHKDNKKMIIEKASNKELELLKDANFKHPENIRASLDHDAIAHILKRHGVNSVNVKNGEIPITNDDIANYRYIVNNADAILRTIDKYDKEAITAFKQINAHAVVVEQAINKKNELALKTMYKNNGNYKNNEVYKKFSSTSLNANAKVPYRLSSYSGATENTIKKPLTSQEGLSKTSENLNETTQEAKNLSPLEQAKAEKLAKLESEKGKEVRKTNAEEAQKGIKERAFKVVEDKEAFLKDLNAIKPMQLPREIDTDSFLNAFNGVKNKENFIKHLKSKPDSKHRLAYLNLVEPTLKEPDITLIFKDQGKEVKKEHIKAFQGDPKTIYYFLVTQDNDSKLITGLRISENYFKAEIDKADIIHSFIPQDS
ncbi:DUF3519 domain-containing protein [Helicobacter pylori]|uniref:DUF3519 domain-containing protein n=1 Tax=Helicobacter pylori TaxID=210 RepID=UPI0020B85BAC|nr:DUF3519 domain-containing protein [Helicobacter pylori]